MEKNNKKVKRYYIYMVSMPDLDKRTIEEEKAYRRGFHQGVAFILDNLDDIKMAPDADLKSMEADLRKWRFGSEIKVENTVFEFKK